jgi:acyl-CoA synthetase (AMP-forming)/AMP-acid ligase II
LLIEKTADDIDTLSKQINNIYPAYERPKVIHPVDVIPLTENGKIDRKACKEFVSTAKTIHITGTR